MAHSELAAKGSKREHARAQFLASLNRRLTALLGALDALELDRSSSNGVAVLRRRLQAMADAATALDLEAIAVAFSSAENVLAGVGSQGLLAMDATQVRDTLQLVPELVPEEPLVSTVNAVSTDSVVTTLPTSGNETAKEAAAARGELALVERERHLKQLQELGDISLVSFGLENSESQIVEFFSSCERLTARCYSDLENAVAAVEHYAPDVVLVDGRRADSMIALRRLAGLAPCIVTEADPRGTAWANAAAVSCRGDDLARHIFHVVKGAQSKLVSASERELPAAPTLSEFADRVSTELKQALLEGQSVDIASRKLELGPDHPAQATVWSAAAKLRGMVRAGSSGAIDYPSVGPGGALLADSTTEAEFEGEERRGRRGIAHERSLSGKTVIVADGDPAIAWFLTSILRSKGANVVEARDGRQAWDKCVEHVPALIVSDVLLPELDGFALCRNLKRDIVLSDVPVVLLSWKEELLQRVRELGAGADGYLPKEADASTILSRCCEALYPRARVEERIQSGEVVYGRLDGVTPRLVLQLACHHSSAARVAFHDAAFTYEAHVGDGRLLALRRVSKDGKRDHGDSALPGLLGMRAGRFVVEPIREVVEQQFVGSLPALLRPHVERTRRTQVVLQGSRIAQVVRIDLDEAVMEPYLQSSPRVVSRLVNKLAAGTAPAAFLKSISAALLESVLFDVVQRGAVKAVWNKRGENLLEAPGTEFSLVDIDVKTPDVGVDVFAAPGAPRVSSESTAADVERAITFADRMAKQQPAKPDEGSNRQDGAGTTADIPVAMQQRPDRQNDEPAWAPATAAPTAKAVAAPASGDAGHASASDVGSANQVATQQSPAAKPAEPVLELGQFLLNKLLGTTAATASAPCASLSETSSEPAAAKTRDEPRRVVDPKPVVLPRTPTKIGLQNAADEKLRPRVPVEFDGHDTEDDTPTEAPGFLNPVAFLAEDEASLIQPASKASIPQRISKLGKAIPGPAIAALLALGGAYGGWLILTAEPEETFTEKLPTEPSTSEQALEQGTLSLLPEQAAKPETNTQAPSYRGKRAGKLDGSQEQLSLRPPGAAEADPHLTRLELSELPLPSGVTVASGRGLIEVVTNGKERLYVNGDFVGRGPVRRIPVHAGEHTVMERSGDEERQYEVLVKEGLRLRLGSVPKPDQP